MYIGGELLERQINSNRIKVETKSGDKTLKIGPNSIDVTLSDVIYVMNDYPPVVDLDKPLPDELYTKRNISEKGYVLHPGDFILASVQERFIIDPRLLYIPHYEGRSTMARLAVLSHVSAGFGDFGFVGAFTLEIKNLGKAKIRLMPGMRIGQVYFTEVVSPKGYSGYDQSNFEPQLPIIGPGRF
jgi:dCTP deaminase